MFKSVIEPLATTKINVFNMSIYSYPIILVPESELDTVKLQLSCYCRIYDGNEIIEPLKIVSKTL